MLQSLNFDYLIIYLWAAHFWSMEDENLCWWMCYVVFQHPIASTNCIWVFKRKMPFCWIFFWSYVRFGVWRLLFCQISSKHWSKDVCSLSFMLGAKLFNKNLIHLKTFYQNWSKDVKISCSRIKNSCHLWGTLWLRTLSMSFNLGLSFLLQQICDFWKCSHDDAPLRNTLKVRVLPFEAILETWKFWTEY